MGFFDDLKQDLSMAVGELLPDEANSGEETIDLAAQDQEELDRILASSGIYSKESEPAGEITEPVITGESDEELLANLLKGLPDLPEAGSVPTEEELLVDMPSVDEILAGLHAEAPAAEEAVDLSDVEDLLGDIPSVDELLAGVNAEAGLVLPEGTHAEGVPTEALAAEAPAAEESVEEAAENQPSVEEILAGLNLSELPEETLAEAVPTEALAVEAPAVEAPSAEESAEAAENQPSVEEILAGLNLSELPEETHAEGVLTEALAAEAPAAEAAPAAEESAEAAENQPSVEEILAGLNLSEFPEETHAEGVLTEAPVAEESAIVGASLEAPAEEVPVVEPIEEASAEGESIQAYENQSVSMMSEEPRIPTDTLALITEGMNVSGDIKAEGSLELQGRVGGNLDVWGKLTVTGTLIGNAKAKEVYAENARITGDVFSETSVKLGSGSVVMGNITAFSAAIAGAVRGDIDVHGPVILDSTAVVLGNIRSKSIQINNGAMVEGICSQCYAEISPSAFFDTLMKTGTRPEM